MNKRQLYKLFFILALIAISYFLIIINTPVIYRNFIVNLENFYSNQSLETLDKYNPLYSRYGISVKDLDYKLCKYMLESLGEDIPFFTYLSNHSQKIAIYHLCAIKLHSFIQTVLEEYEASFGKANEEIYRKCINHYIIEHKESWVELKKGPLITCLVNSKLEEEVDF